MPSPIHPSFDPVTQTWFADGVEDCKSLAEMAKKTKRKIVGYYPEGFRGEVSREGVHADWRRQVHPTKTRFMS